MPKKNLTKNSKAGNSSENEVVGEGRRLEGLDGGLELLLLPELLLVLFLVVLAVALAHVARALGGVVVEAVAQTVDVGAFDAGELADGAATDTEIRHGLERFLAILSPTGQLEINQ